MNGRPRSQKLYSDSTSTSIILNPATGHPNLIESNSFPQGGAHIISHHPVLGGGGGQPPCVAYHPSNEWMPPPQYLGIQSHDGSVSGSSIERVLPIVGEHNLQNEVSSSCMNPLNNYNNATNAPHIISSHQLRGGSIPSASDTNFIPDLEDASSIVGGGLAPLPMQPISDQYLVRYSTIGRQHNRLHNHHQIGNTVTSPR